MIQLTLECSSKYLPGKGKASLHRQMASQLGEYMQEHAVPALFRQDLEEGTPEVEVELAFAPRKARSAPDISVALKVPYTAARARQFPMMRKRLRDRVLSAVQALCVTEDVPAMDVWIEFMLGGGIDLLSDDSWVSEFPLRDEPPQSPQSVLDALRAVLGHDTPKANSPRNGVEEVVSAFAAILRQASGSGRQ